MEIINSNKDLRIIIRTTSELVLDTTAYELEVEDELGRFTMRAPAEPTLAALVPSELVLRKHDGSEIHVNVSWGSLTVVGHQARIVVHDARVEHIEPMRIAV